MLVIVWILLVLLLGLMGWLEYHNLQHPVIQPAKTWRRAHSSNCNIKCGNT